MNVVLQKLGVSQVTLISLCWAAVEGAKIVSDKGVVEGGERRPDWWKSFCSQEEKVLGWYNPGLNSLKKLWDGRICLSSGKLYWHIALLV